MKLRIVDLDVQRGLIYVRVAKGRNDRYTMCPTHLLESGVDLRYNQELQGHKSSKDKSSYIMPGQEIIRNSYIFPKWNKKRILYMMSYTKSNKDHYSKL